MFRIAVCDDDNSICAHIENIIMKYKEKNSLDLDVEILYSGEGVCDFLNKEHGFDLIFLDIELRNMSGIDVANFIRRDMDDQTTQIVYISGKENYYKDLFETRPMNFILKPVEEDKVIKNVLSAMKLSDRLSGIFSYKKGHETFKKPVSEIIYFESADREIKMITTGTEELFYGKISDIYNKLSKYRFMNIHKSYVVNYQHVVNFKYDEVTMSNGVCLPISQLRRKKIKKLQTEYESEEM